ncbi:tRNA pseudouridine synthase A [Nymphon striatum]|nr:tRNA pseudouridine synthase A [Nymphon striatum]
MAKYLLRLAYDGGPFRGFAINEGVPTVGGTLRAALEQVLQHAVPIVCAGRTDAGVHALDQAVSFTTTQDVQPEALRTSLNSLCKPHIVVHSVTAVADEFDARYSCTGRTYRYRILNQRLPDPFRKDYTWRVAQPLDVDAMRAASSHLLGTHDFTTFCREVSHPRVTQHRLGRATRQRAAHDHLRPIVLPTDGAVDHRPAGRCWPRADEQRRHPRDSCSTRPAVDPPGRAAAGSCSFCRSATRATSAGTAIPCRVRREALVRDWHTRYVRCPRPRVRSLV